MPRMQYKALVEPILPPILADQWFAPASEPVRQKPRALQSTWFFQPLATIWTVDLWHNQQPPPVRRIPRCPVLGDTFEPLEPSLRRVPAMDFPYPAQIPVRRRHWDRIEAMVAPVKPEDFAELQWLQQTVPPIFVAPAAVQTCPYVEPFVATIPPEQVLADKWTFISPDPVRRTPRPVDAGINVQPLEPTLTTAFSMAWYVQQPAAPIAKQLARFGIIVTDPPREIINLDKYWRQASEPVRQRPRAQQSTWLTQPLDPSLTHTPNMGWLNQPPQIPVKRIHWQRPGQMVEPIDPSIVTPPLGWLGQPIQNPTLPRRSPEGAYVQPVGDFLNAVPSMAAWWRQLSEPVRMPARNPEGGTVEPLLIQFIDWIYPPQVPKLRILSPEGQNLEPLDPTAYPNSQGWLQQASAGPPQARKSPEGQTVEPVNTDVLLDAWQPMAAILVQPRRSPLGGTFQPVVTEPPVSAWMQQPSAPIARRYFVQPGGMVEPTEPTLWTAPPVLAWYQPASEPVRPIRLRSGIEQGLVEVWFVGQEITHAELIAVGAYVPGPVALGYFVPGGQAIGEFVPGGTVFTAAVTSE